MINPKNFVKLPEKRRKEVISAILLNAYALYTDAKKLGDIGSFGHAAALFVIAREETAKALVLSSPESAPDVRDLRDHAQKQSVLGVQTFGRNPVTDMFQLITRNARQIKDPSSESESRAAIDNAMREYLSILTDHASKSALHQRFKLRYNERQYIQSRGSSLKNSGLYVDVSATGTYSSPAEMEESLVKALQNAALEDIYWTDLFCNESQLSKEFGIDTPFRFA